MEFFLRTPQVKVGFLKRSNKTTPQFHARFGFQTFHHYCLTYKWSCGFNNSASFQRRSHVMIHPNIRAQMNDFFFYRTQFVVRVIHGFMITLEFCDIFGVLEKKVMNSAFFSGFISFLRLTLNSSPRQSALKRGTSNSSTFTAKLKSFLMVIEPHTEVKTNF